MDCVFIQLLTCLVEAVRDRGWYLDNGTYGEGAVDIVGWTRRMLGEVCGMTVRSLCSVETKRMTPLNATLRRDQSSRFDRTVKKLSDALAMQGTRTLSLERN